MHVILILCLLQGETQTAQIQSLQNQIRAFQAVETPGRHLGGIQHTLGSLGIATLSLLGSKAMQWVHDLGQVWAQRE